MWSKLFEFFWYVSLRIFEVGGIELTKIMLESHRIIRKDFVITSLDCDIDHQLTTFDHTFSKGETVF